jgi:hypothetical protein
LRCPDVSVYRNAFAIVSRRVGRPHGSSGVGGAVTSRVVGLPRTYLPDTCRVQASTGEAAVVVSASTLRHPYAAAVFVACACGSDTPVDITDAHFLAFCRTLSAVQRFGEGSDGFDICGSGCCARGCRWRACVHRARRGEICAGQCVVAVCRRCNPCRH